MNSIFSTPIPKKILSLKKIKKIELSIEQAALQVDYFELRVDDFSEEDWLLFRKYTQKKPWVLKTVQIENFFYSIQFYPDWVDLDFETFLAVRPFVPKNTKIILSSHFKTDLEGFIRRYEQMKRIEADLYKLVVEPTDHLEALKITWFIQKENNLKLIAFCLGKSYRYTRILAGHFRQYFGYFGLEGYETGDGQLNLKECVFYEQAVKAAIFFGLIGDPIEKSVADTVYNTYFQKKGITAAYIKIPLNANQVKEGLELIDQIGLKGLSITTPLKDQMVLNQTYNTRIMSQQGIDFANTDVEAILDLYPVEKWKKKKVLVIGCGALGTALIKALSRYSKSIYLINRTEQKGWNLIEKDSVKLYQNENWDFDLVIQTTSAAFLNEKEMRVVFRAAQVIECVHRPVWTDFLRKQIGQAEVTFGFEFFLEQGIRQLKKWMPDHNFDDFIPFSRSICLQALLKR